MDKYFKLSVELGTRPKDELASIVNQIWAQGYLDGPYIDMSGLQPKRLPELYPYGEDSYGHNICQVQSHWGYASLPNGYRVPCLCDIRYHGTEKGHGLEMSISLEALNVAYQTELSHLSNDRLDPPWYTEIEGWFIEMGKALDEAFGFQSGIIGMETDLNSLGDVRRDGIPEDRRRTLLLEAGQWVPWYPSDEPRQRGAVRSGTALWSRQPNTPSRSAAQSTGTR